MRRTASILFVCGGLAFGQSRFDPEPAPRDVGFGGEETVEIVEGWPFLVTGACSELGPHNVRVLEDDSGVEVVAADRAERPTYHVLLLDTSASMSHPLNDRFRRRGEQTKAAARAYVEWMYEDAQEAAARGAAGEPIPELMLLTFDDDLILRAPSTPVRTPADVERLHRIIDSIGGGERTFLNDALSRLMTYLGGLPERAVVILLSDGEDTSMRIGAASVVLTGASRSVPEVLRIVNETNNVTVFTIGIGLEPGDHAEFLRQVAAVSGGRHFAVPDKKPERLGAALADRFAEIRERLQNEFYVSWTPRPVQPGEMSVAQVAVRIESMLARCRVEPQSYRPRRFVRSAAPVDPAGAWEAEPAPERLAADRVMLRILDAVRDDNPLRPGSDIYDQRNVHLLVPDFDLHTRPSERAAPGATRPATEEVIRNWMIGGALPPPQLDRGRYSYPLAHEISGRSFLDSRYRIASAVYEHFEPYRMWARARIAGRIRAEYRRKLARPGGAEERQDGLEAKLDTVVALRLDALRPEEIGRALAAWHRDLPARELALGIERLQVESLLAGAAGAQKESSAIQRAWPRLYDWLRPPGRVRLTTPLVLTYDPDRDVFGLSRIVLPRAGSWPADSVPAQPYGLQLVRWMLGLDPFEVDDTERVPHVDAPLAQALRGFSLESLDYSVEPVVPTERKPELETLVPLERHHYRLLLRPSGSGEIQSLDLVADTVFLVPPGWDGKEPLAWTYAHGPMKPERLILRCFTADGPASSIERALEASGVPACP